MDASAEGTIREYYDALGAGEPLHPFFAERGPIVKVGIGERMVGADAVADGLREQTRTTTGWEVESRDLHVDSVGVTDRNSDDGGVKYLADDPQEGDDVKPTFAWFGDDVFMGWMDTERGIRFEFDTRWSGAMARLEGEWRFVEMHVSTAGET